MNLVYNRQSLCIRIFGYSIIARVAIWGGSATAKFCVFWDICSFACFLAHLFACNHVCYLSRPLLVYCFVAKRVFVMASPVLRVVMFNLEKRGACVFLCVFGELLDRIIVQLIECFSVENG